MELEDVEKQLTNIFYKKTLISLEELEEIFKSYIELLFMKSFKSTKKPIIEINNSKIESGSYNGYNQFFINRNQIKAFQRGEALSLFETISHELEHFRQNKESKSISVKNSLMEKDNYLCSLIDDYYEDNYVLLVSEIDAYLYQQSEALKLLKRLEISPSENEMFQSNTLKDFFMERGITSLRVDHGDLKDLFDIYEEILLSITCKDSKEDLQDYLNSNPCSNIEYKIVDDSLVRKSSLEIEKMYNEWKLGKLKLEGNSNEIRYYFAYIIFNLSKKENIVKKSIDIVK